MFKALLSAAFSRLSPHMPFTLLLTHPNGATQTYGSQPTPRFEIGLSSPDAYRRILLGPSLGFAELYAENKLVIKGDGDPLFELLRAFYAIDLENVFPGLRLYNRLKRKLQARANPPAESRNNANSHYDANDEIVRKITGKTQQYSCAFFARPHWSLDAAQYGKMDYLLNKLRLQPGMALLDIGCGYGALIRRAATEFHVKALGITLSHRQQQEGNRLISDAGLQHACEIRLADFRSLSATFDRIVSVGMYEHVGAKAWEEYFQKVDALLNDGGVFALQTVCLQKPQPMDPFIRRHIFPGSELPSVAEVLKAAAGTRLQCRHFENLQAHYARTCLAWLANLRACREELVSNFGSWRYRAFEIYLAGGAASFSVPQGMQLGQFVFTKGRADWPASTEFMTQWLARHI